MKEYSSYFVYINSNNLSTLSLVTHNYISNNVSINSNLNVNSNNMQVIEDVFSVFGHAVYSTLSSKL